MRIFIPVACCLLFSVACSSSKNDGSPNTSESSPQGSAALSCGSYTFCTSYTVATYYGQSLPALHGGIIADGLYREGYVLRSDATDAAGNKLDKSTDGGDAFLIQGNSYLRLGTGQVGALAPNGAKVTLTPASSCTSSDGTEDSAGGDVYTYTYGVDASGNLLLSLESGEVKAYLKVDQLCAGATATPETPGDSFACHVHDCGCAEKAGGPADADTCKLVEDGS